MMESPDEASEMACPMVLQADWGDLQLLLLLPFTPIDIPCAAGKGGGSQGQEHSQKRQVDERDSMFHNKAPFKSPSSADSFRRHSGTP